MITVFYDAKCGLCRREIEHYKRIAPDNIFDWHDITHDSSYLLSLGIAYADGLKLLHAADSQGNIHIGIDAFILMWQHMPRWRILAAVVSLPFIRTIANQLYRAFAAWRFNRLDHCQLAAQSKEK